VRHGGNGKMHNNDECPYKEIVERLKERIPQLKKKLEYLKYEGNMATDNDITTADIILELQSILKGDKE